MEEVLDIMIRGCRAKVTTSTMPIPASCTRF